MANKKIGVAIIGSGSIATHRHAPEYAARPDVRILAFADRVPERAETLARKYDAKAFSHYEEALALKGVDAVSVCTPNALHAPITIAALEAGKHVLCEKPMATSDQEAKAMIAAAQKAGKVLMIGHNQRLAPLHVKAKQLIADGVIGKVLSFRTSFSHPGPESWSIEGATGWFFDKKQAFVGSMGDLGVHKADLIRFLLGEEIVEVAAFVEHLDKPMGDVDDNAVCILKTASGAIGTLTASWTHYPGEDNATYIYGSKGHIRIGADPRFSVMCFLKNGEKQYYEVGALQTNEAGGQSASGVIDAFVESIRTNTPPPISGEEGRRSLAVIIACLKAAETRRYQKVAL
ncbi:MAG: Gfo/Idh/MocA family oxidoreductase [Chloroherpetonaceae bacterium]|nr:Gfo/Idh/MocA family oxidoreductase [Chthonomonadaceae bacterium]MDW8207287.1 Gfo/Idh/MocA family oxidoreductase [Chloroherpetonaceae bacterium]